MFQSVDDGMYRQSDNPRHCWAERFRVWNQPHGMFGRRWLHATLSVPPVDVSALIGADAC